MKNNRTMLEKKIHGCPFSHKDSPKIDYKDVRLLSRYLSEKGKILPSRITNVSNQNQKKLSQAIKRARYLAFLSHSEKIFRSNS